MQPIVNGLEADYSIEMTFWRLNALDGGEGEQIFNQLGLPGHPSILIFDRDGSQVYRGVGIVDEDVLQQEISAVLQRE